MTLTSFFFIAVKIRFTNVSPALFMTDEEEEKFLDWMEKVDV